MAKTLFTKIVVALLLVSMLVSGLVACSGSDTTKAPSTNKTPTTTAGPTSTTAPGTGTQTPTTTGGTPSTGTPPTTTIAPPVSTAPIDVAYPEQLAGMKDQITPGTTLNFVYVEGASGTYTADSIWVDADAGDLDDVKQKVYERNNKIFEDLGVTINPVTDPTLGIGDLQTWTSTSFNSQLDDIDVYCGYQYFDISLATQGHLYNLNDITHPVTGDTLIDYTQPYWATRYIDSITYNDNMYWVTGDLAFRYTGGLYCTFVNNDLYDTYVKANYDNKTIYQIVKEGKWTMQTMLDMAALIQGDEDDNGQIDDGETCGIVFEALDTMDGIAFGCQVDFSSKTLNQDGTTDIAITLHTDKKASALAGFINKMYTGKSFAYNIAGNDSANAMPYFADGLALFTINKLYQSAVYLYDMENFSIIPTPKLNDSQTAYGSGCHDSMTIFGISKYSENAVASAATLELMAYYGSKLVTPVFYQNYILGSRTVRDEESIEMIQTIRNGFDSDFAAAWGNSINSIVHIYRDPAACERFDTRCKINSKQWNAKLEKLLIALDEAVEK